MNIKLHTPKSLKSGSGMSSMKQFLLSILATTVSIALTFGTAAIVDGKKKQKEKREIVMMVMYDMYTSLKPVEKSDSMIRKLLDIQEKLAADTSLFTFDTKLKMYMMLPNIQYTETTENIFSSNIETINTVGNVLFTENVATFYQTRKRYKAEICDSLNNEVKGSYAFNTLDEATNAVLLDYSILSCGYLLDMQYLFAQCKQMMKVTDKELETYHKERSRMDKDLLRRDEYVDSVTQEVVNQQQRIFKLRDKWRKK